MVARKLKIGLLVNPMAGIGGPVALKGSDGVFDEAVRRGGRSRVPERVGSCLARLPAGPIEWLTLPGAMGGDLLAGVAHRLLGAPPGRASTAADTRRGAQALSAAGVDLLLFAGGDGTARDLVDAVGRVPAVLGIPCGVKMHSGVFANTPGAAAALINKLLAGELLSVTQAEVRDIDEVSFREGIVRTRFYGELPVPDDLRYVQQTKVGGREVEALVMQEIAADFLERMDPDTLYIMGSGATIAGLLDAMGRPATLLGIDVMRGGKVIAADVTEGQLLALLAGGGPAKLIVTAIGGQGHIFGRGNQQLSARVIGKVGIGNIEIIATRSKLASLHRRPLLADTGDEALDEALAGMKTIVTGYEDRVLYRLG